MVKDAQAIDPAQGHLFVVHGLIEDVAHDMAIIPTDDKFSVRDYWSKVIDLQQTGAQHWETRTDGFLIYKPNRSVLAVSVDASYNEVLNRIHSCLTLAKQNAKPRNHRQLPLVAVPVIGIEGGGHDNVRGKVVQQLVDRLHESAKDLDVDVVLVVKEASVYSAAQWVRRKHPGLQPEWEKATARLGGHAKNGNLALLLGAGVSAAAGLPSWNELLHNLDGKDAERSALSPTDRAELIEKHNKSRFQQLVREQIDVDRSPSLLHALLAGLNCREVVTTNYDLLYERAAKAASQTISVLPWARAQPGKPWLLKLHGDIGKNHLKSIVLTRRHMVTYDAKNRPSTALLQSLFLTRHLLIVGTSMTDDNVLRMLHEVNAYQEAFLPKRARAVVGTVLDTDLQKERAELWKGILAWCDLKTHETDNQSFRILELFLDRLAFHAISESSWLLDARFADLLGETGLPADSAQVAAEARELRRRLSSHTAWAPLRKALDLLGARGRQ